MKRYVLIASIMFFGLFIISTVLYTNNYILRIQVLFNTIIPTILVWIAVLLLALYFTMSDIGFVKLGTILGIIVALYALIYMAVMSTSSYTTLKNDDYNLIIHQADDLNGQAYNVYIKDGFLTSKYVGQIVANNHYEVTYEIVGDEFVLTKCTENGCQVITLELE